MRSGGNNFNYFPENKLTKLANFVQFIRMLMFCLEDWGRGLGPWAPLATPLNLTSMNIVYLTHLIAAAADDDDVVMIVDG